MFPTMSVSIDDLTTTNFEELTPEEVEEYITQIAFSGATDFIEKYKDNANGDEIIGHFGLGFYSAFMVADEVHIDTLSYKEGAEPVHWECDGVSYLREKPAGGAHALEGLVFSDGPPPG